MSQINQDLYNDILKNMPIICVDGIILKDGNILFLKRNNEPEKDKWWFPGGRIYKNEKLSNAIIRKIKQEISCDVEIVKLIGFTETIFDTGPNNIQVHTINFTYLLKIEGDITIDSDHSEYIWTQNYEELNLNSEIYKILKNNFKNDNTGYEPI